MAEDDELRDIVNKRLKMRERQTDRKIGRGEDRFRCGKDVYDFAKSVEEELPEAFIVSAVEILPGEHDGYEVGVEIAEGEKCTRCWIQSPTVGKDPKHPMLCSRCAEIVG
jgi:isoleucyl-tRNA synthetase